jgi:transcriptional regulator with XRE-family HTH domain
LPNRRLDQATFQALQALMARGQLHVSEGLARAIRERRIELGASVRALADYFEAGADELEGIERGECSVSAGTLVRLAQALQVDLVWFIEREPSFFAGRAEGGPFEVDGMLLDAKEGLALIRAFASIRDPREREAVLELARRYASDDGPEGDPPKA